MTTLVPSLLSTGRKANSREPAVSSTDRDTGKCNAVEVDGLCFETVIADSFEYTDGRFVSIQEQQVFLIPNQPDGETIAYMGFRITNPTNKPVRLSVPASITPTLIGPEGKVGNQVWSGVPRPVSPEAIKPLLIMPGEVTYFLTSARFGWETNQLTMQFDAGMHNYYNFSNLQPGVYQIQLVYDSTIEYKEFHVDAPPVVSITCRSPSDCVLVEHPFPPSSPSPQLSPKPRESLSSSVLEGVESLCRSPLTCIFVKQPLPETSSHSKLQEEISSATVEVWKGVVTTQFKALRLVNE